MNTTQTIQNRDDLGMNDSEDERNRERDEFERDREWNEECDREQAGDRGREKEALSRRVTGAESQHRLREVFKKVQKDDKSGGTTPK